MRVAGAGAGAGARYDAIAERYVALVASHSIPHDTAIPALLDLLGPVAGRPVLDLACGTGQLSRALAAAGAQVVGIDLSAGLLHHAWEQERAAPLGIASRRDDAQCLGSLPDASVDAAACCLGLTDIDDLDALYHAVARVLRPGGVLAFCINHPAAPATSGDGTLTLQPVPIPYLRQRRWRSGNPASVRGLLPTWHRPLAVYLNAALAAGLWLTPPEPLRELPAPAHVLARSPAYRQHPYLFAARLRKPA